jgi:hypothetical protein
MIDLRAEELREAKGLDYWKLRLFGSELPDYLCRNIAEFLEGRPQIRLMGQVAIPRLVYFPHPETDDEKLCLPIKLRDNSGELEVYVRDTAYNREAGKFLVDSLNDIREGDSLAYVVLRNGCVEPNIDGNTDDRIYLAGFWVPRIMRRKKKLSDIVEKLSDLVPDLNPLPSPVPVRI